jgi:small subunit ribosomal protein S16
VVADSRSPRDGKCIEELGTYHPEKAGANFSLDLERAKYWVDRGAQPSDTVSSFIKKAGKAANQPGMALESKPMMGAAPAAPATPEVPATSESAADPGEAPADPKPESN